MRYPAHPWRPRRALIGDPWPPAIENLDTLSTVRSADFGEAYGVALTEGPLAGICARAVIILDENDPVRYTQLVPEIAEERITKRC